MEENLREICNNSGTFTNNITIIKSTARSWIDWQQKHCEKKGYKEENKCLNLRTKKPKFWTVSKLL